VHLRRAKTGGVCRSNDRSFGIRSKAWIGSGAAQAAYARRPQSRRARAEKATLILENENTAEGEIAPTTTVRRPAPDARPLSGQK
jgi:hypothetical protein